MMNRLFKVVLDSLLRIRNRHVFAADLVAFSIAPFLALVLRLDAEMAAERFGIPVFLLGIISVTVGVVVFHRNRLYRRIWRYASIDEAIRIAIASSITGAVLIGIYFLVLAPLDLVDSRVPRSIPFLIPLVFYPIVTAVRIAPRVAQRIEERFQILPVGQRAVIAGAGEAGVMIVRELQGNPETRIVPVAFIDDDPSKKGLRIRGLQVEGSTDEMAFVAKTHKAEQLIIAMPTTTGQTVRRIAEKGRGIGLSVRVIPGVFELVDGSVQVNQLRQVQVEDLLRRPPVESDREKVRALVAGKKILVTGAGGSIGSELCRQIFRAGPAGMMLVGHGENSIFGIDRSLRHRVRYDRKSSEETSIETAIADIRDEQRMRRVFAAFKPELVFHAAAHKHVPLMEAHPDEAVTNNVSGTRVVARLAEEFGTERFVLISTDKAVNPTSVMGATKRIAEMVVYEIAERTGRPFMAVRFGNVLGSRGSVIETFRAQLREGGPITVTHPDMERYFMTIPEAVQLTLQASSMGTGGEVFVLDMGERVRIVDLAKDMIRLSGLKEGADIDIVYSGLRPGEKLFEEMFLPDEVYERTDHRGVFVCPSAMRSVGETGNGVSLSAMVDGLVGVARAGNKDAVREMLMRMVPEYGATVDTAEGQGVKAE